MEPAERSRAVLEDVSRSMTDEELSSRQEELREEGCLIEDDSDAEGCGFDWSH